MGCPFPRQSFRSTAQVGRTQVHPSGLPPLTSFLLLATRQNPARHAVIDQNQRVDRYLHPPIRPVLRRKYQQTGAVLRPHLSAFIGSGQVLTATKN